MSYCISLTDRQVNNVYYDERFRVKVFRNPDKSLLLEARTELARRGLLPDRAAWERPDWARTAPIM